MGCSSCQQNNHVVPSTHAHNHSSHTHCECACGCSEPVCPTPQPCTEITDSKCTIYTDAAIKCGNATVVAQGASVSTALNQVVNYFCTQSSLVTTANISCGSTVIVSAGLTMQQALAAVVQYICNIPLTPTQIVPSSVWGNGFTVVGCIDADLVLPANVNLTHPTPLAMCVGRILTIPVSTTLTII